MIAKASVCPSDDASITCDESVLRANVERAAETFTLSLRNVRLDCMNEVVELTMSCAIRFEHERKEDTFVIGG